jgi:hypothetical protein
MNQLKLTAFICLLFTSSMIFISCEKQEDTKYTISSLPVTFAQVALPAGVVIPPSPAVGTLTGVYTKVDRTFSYTINWSGLVDTISAIHIHALAEKGLIALPAPLGPFANGIVQSFTSGFTRTKTGSYSGTLYIDGNIIREEDFLSGKYYIDIHSKSAPYSSTGELRAQIEFDK